ncbi:Protein rolling stone [Camponotus japonicus]
MPPECEEIEIRGMLERNECAINQVVVNKSPKLLALCGRRAMVSKFWCHEIGRRWRQGKQEPPQARVLTEPKCQSHVATCYKPLFQYEKWPIYLTNWDVLLGFTQALIGGILVSKRWRLQKIPSFDPCGLKLKSTERLYWFLYVVTTNLAIGVTFCYWFTVYNPEIHQLDPLNIMMHVCNSVLMLVDFVVTSIPFRLRNFWWCLSIAVFYCVFTAIYYIAGGLDKYGYHYIYRVIDWKRPARTLLVCVGGCTFITVLHCVSCMLADVRDRVYRKIAEKLGKPVQTNNAKSLPEKQPEVV